MLLEPPFELQNSVLDLSFGGLSGMNCGVSVTFVRFKQGVSLLLGVD